jgi:hypothetical protein
MLYLPPPAEPVLVKAETAEMLKKDIVIGFTTLYTTFILSADMVADLGLATTTY